MVFGISGFARVEAGVVHDRILRRLWMGRGAFLAALMLFTVSAPNAHAQEDAAPRAVGTHEDWTAFTVEDAAGDLICFALTEAADSLPPNVRHGDVYFMVSTWRSGLAEEQPSFLAGYDLKADSTVTARVDGVAFPMFPSQNEAFVEREADEKRLIAAMRRGRSLEIQAFSARGTETAYRFSLLGVTAATQQAVQACQ